MSGKRALVVDDSKSARVVLSRMLEKYGIVVDTAESAEMALESLPKARPDVVFMDHLMPGMDGLQAVRLLKADPATADIPVVMYTSQEGELYVGQAKALGAIGVLPKTVRPIDVTKILYQLKLLPDRRDARPSALQAVVQPTERKEAPEHAAVEPVAAPEQVPDARVRGFIEAMLKEQSLELRRFMVATLDSHAQRLLSELKRAEPDEPLPPPPVVETPAARPWGWIVALVILVGALVLLGGLYWQSLQTEHDVVAARERLERESAGLRSTLDEVRRAASVRAAAGPPQAPARPREQVLSVPYGEPPLAPTRLDAVRSLVAGLERDGFAGTVAVQTIAGRFCLDGNADTGYSLAPPADPADSCEYRGNPYDDSLTGAARQPLAFANLAASLRQRTAGRISLTMAQGSPEQVVVAYPPPGSVTAGDWNEAAAANNRVEITVVPK